MDQNTEGYNPYFTDCDRYLFCDGTNYELYKKMGAHVCEIDGVWGTLFTVWAPHAQYVAVLTEANGWDEGWPGCMERSWNGVWQKFIPGAHEWQPYRFAITGADGIKRYKSDPFAFWTEKRPGNCSIISRLDSYTWGDDEYMSKVDSATVLNRPMSIYEVHLGSWKKDYSLNEDGFLNYADLAHQLADYVNYMGYTHVEVMGICEYPFDGSWGYQVTGYYSPTSRHGTPDDFRYFVDYLHRHNIGVILDFVPAHFPKDVFGLESFDGTPLYEFADPLRSEFPEWGTKAFDVGKPEVKSFLISAGFYWINEFHVDALRIDAAAAMFYNNFARSEWRKNIYGGDDNIEGINFLRQFNYAVETFTKGFMIAEDSSIIQGVTDDVKNGGIGFKLKWNMGWMNDTLKYIGKDPVYRKWHHGELTHTADYAFTENFVNVLSHDEVVHLKHSMVEKFPGSNMDKLGGLKSLYTFQYTTPGKKLLFMGQDFADDREWDENREIGWYFADDFGHRDVMQCVKNLLGVYKTYPSLYTDSKDSRTFEWVNRNDADRNIIAFIRRNPWTYDGAVLVVINFSPVDQHDYTCGVPMGGAYKRVFSTYDSLPGGGNPDEIGGVPVIIPERHDCDGYDYRVLYSLRPYESIIVAFPEPEKPENKAEEPVEVVEEDITVEIFEEPADEPKKKAAPKAKAKKTAEK